MRILRLLPLLAVLLAAACSDRDVSYDFSDLDERNLTRGEPE